MIGSASRDATVAISRSGERSRCWGGVQHRPAIRAAEAMSELG